MHRTTPCVGICSTTYGDLICRGCKRFAHEIVQWNGYGDDQRDAVWRRLRELRDGSVAKFVSRVQVDALVERADELNVRHDRAMTVYSVAYEVLRRLVLRQLPLPNEGNRVDWHSDPHAKTVLTYHAPNHALCGHLLDHLW